MAPVRTMVLPRMPRPSTAAVCSMESVPWVMTMRLAGDDSQRSRMSWRPASVICRLSIIMRVSTARSRRQRPSLSMSAMCVCLKNNSPVSSLYCLSKVPPVTKIWMGCWFMRCGEVATLYYGWHKSRLGEARYSEINPMRGMRWLVLVVIAAVLCGVVLTYLTKKKAIRAQVLPTPQPLPPEIAGTSEEVVWTIKDHQTGCTTVVIKAGHMSEQKDSGRDDLVGARLYIYHKCEEKYDVVESAEASYYPSEKRLYSEGQVHISLGERADSETPASLAEITTSGVTFDTETGHA